MDESAEAFLAGNAVGLAVWGRVSEHLRSAFPDLAVRVTKSQIASVDQVDDEVLGWLRDAGEAAGA